MDEQRPLPIPVADDFPVQWEDPSDVQNFWTRDRMHFPDQITILEHQAILMGDAGNRKAFEHYGIPAANWSRRINTYVYGTTLPTARPDEMAANEAALEADYARSHGRSPKCMGRLLSTRNPGAPGFLVGL